MKRLKNQKTTPYAKAKRKAWQAFAKYIKIRDCLKTTGTTTHGVCVSCGETFPINKLQAGHFVPGRTLNILFDEEIVNAQCSYCNNCLEGNQHEYRKSIVKMYGEGYDDVLHARRHQEDTRYTITDYKEIAQKYKEKTERLECST